MQPFISVLVPVYNVEEYVEACLDSLLAQDFEDFEAIVIDDGSTDGSAALVDHYASSDPRVRVIHKENAGYGAALNLGLAHAKGEYIAILESDDVMCVHALAHMAHIARTHHIDSYHGGFRLWWSASNTFRSVSLFSPSICGHVFDPREDLRCYITMPSLWAGLYRRACIERARISFLETPGASFQDTSFAFKVFASAQSCYVDNECIILYRQDREGSSIHNLTKAPYLLGEYQEINSFCEAHRAQNPRLAEASITAALNGCLWYLDRFSEDGAYSFAFKLSEYFKKRVREDATLLEVLDPWRARNLRALIADPKRYTALRLHAHANPLSKMWFAYRLGGFEALFQALAERKKRL